MESKSFDKIIKENLEEILLPLAKKLLGFEIVHSKPITEKIQTTLEREPDFIRMIETDEKEEFILHLEFQTTNDSEMVFRQAEYKAIYQRKFKIPVKQYLIYLGSQRMQMEEQLPEAFHIKGFEVKNIHELDFVQLASSDIPEEIILAILGDFHDVPPQQVIKQILKRLFEVSRGELELQKYVRQLNILSRLRKLQDITIKTINTMPITYDIQKDELFLKGIEQGIEQGLEQGLEQGMAKGMEKEKVNLIKNLLALGSLTINQIALVTETTEEFVLAVQEELQSKKEEE